MQNSFFITIINISESWYQFINCYKHLIRSMDCETFPLLHFNSPISIALRKLEQSD